ncbi:MAG: DNA-directed RNA polymerase subunit beta' [Anaerolineae bacterium]|nr:DNA-directed RNA polymerase subunit beta' [Anaerolineae bacterium]
MEVNDFSRIRISLASPEEMLSWSYGEVTKPETINYRTLRPERDGLFCERIFGPTRDFECYCGKYKRVRYRGVVCDKCGVEVTRKEVRRERMGHIKLAAPVAHIWYVKGVPSRLGLLLNISPRNLERILYFAQYIIYDVNEDMRTRTMQRLQKEASTAIQALEQQAEQRVEAEIGTSVEAQLQELDAEIEETKAAIEKDMNDRADAVMSETRTLQEWLEEHMGVPSPKAVRVSSLDRDLLREGETVSQEHVHSLKGWVEERLTTLKTDADSRLEEVRRTLGGQRERAEFERTQQSEGIRMEAQREADKITAKLQEQLDELKAIRERELISETHYYDLAVKWGNIFSAGMGAEAVYEIVRKVDLDKLAEELRIELRTTHSKARRQKAAKRLRVVESFRKSGARPEWMILTTLPVIPPDLRPMVQLDGGRFATSDLNDLYRRVINRNNRLKRLLELGAPDVIVRNEKRMLQEAVDSLIDNGRRGRMVSRSGRRKLKSLSDMLKGKQGRFRRNLLGKRVDYSGRSVIVVGPDLALHQCGLPKTMALELFKPFVMRRLVEREVAHNIKSAKRMVERMAPEVWDILAEVVKDRPVLLNRAPTLHRLGIQAFEVVLIEGNAIQIHPLVCSAFNADFDGDQMAVHVPLSDRAVKEAREIMLASVNLLKPASGEPIVGPTKDMVLGCHYLTSERLGAKGEGKAFSSADEVETALAVGLVHPRARIKLRLTQPDGTSETLETTAGRVIFNSMLPEELRFVNRVMDKSALSELVGNCYTRLGEEPTALMVDRIKHVGFRYATQSGTTIAVSDIQVPEVKESIIAEATARVEDLDRLFRRGLITEMEKYQRTVAIWSKAKDDLTDAVQKNLSPSDSLGAMAASGATKGGIGPISQLAGMRGLMGDPSGRIIALPIRSSFREGLTALEYFLSTHGARKGQADTALRTADAGYLTRRLVDVAQDVIIEMEDCGTDQGVWIDRPSSERLGESFAERLTHRVAGAAVVDEQTGEIIVDRNELITEDLAHRIMEMGVEQVLVRSPLTCEARHGLCQLCYGGDLARGDMIAMGEAVGIIAAQSIGEPGTQLTLRTFHTGGVADREDITRGLPRVEELFEARIPKGEAVIADIDGTVNVFWDGEVRKLRITSSSARTEEHLIPEGHELLLSDGDHVPSGSAISRDREDPTKTVMAEHPGTVFFEDDKAIVRYDETIEEEYEIPASARLRVEEGQTVQAGEQLTEGSKNPRELLRVLGRGAVQNYLLEEVQSVYRAQGVVIHDKHIELIVRKMLNKVRVRTPGDTEFLPGELVERNRFEEVNGEVVEQGGDPSTGQDVLLGITKGALSTDSFLAAASFQETTRVLADAAVRGAVDELRGLKESVIIGKLIPVGTGLLPGYGQEAQLAAGDDENVLGLGETELVPELEAGEEPEPTLDQEPDAAG